MTQWSPYQEAVFAAVEQTSANLVVEALAGSGKTTTIIEICKRLQAQAGGSVLLCAFNRRIKDELVQRAPRGVDVQTCHALGFAAVKRAFGRECGPDNQAESARLFEAGRAAGRVLRGDLRAAALDMVGWAKNTLAEPSETTAYECGAAFRVNGDLGYVIDLARRVLERSRERAVKISFDDMIWLPHELQLQPRQYDVVLVDETQDLCRAQIELVCSALRPGGRVIAVGDTHQAIYGFRGADEDAIPSIVQRFDAKVLPLSICYRCPQTVIALAQGFVAEIECAASAPEGEVLAADAAALRDGAKPGDAVLSRTNAPLIPLCLGFLRRGIPAVVAGRDVAEMIKGRIERAREKVGEMVPAVDAWVRGWADEETRKAMKHDDDARVAVVQDILDTILAVLDGCDTAAEAIQRCDELFANVEHVAHRITFSTIHKAKGLEFDRVWVLEQTLRPGKNQEEDNLCYVAYTRAKQTLFRVGDVREEVR